MLCWRSLVPESFKFAIKAPRQLSHVKRLHECSEWIAGTPPSARALEGRARSDPGAAQSYSEEEPSQWSKKIATLGVDTCGSFEHELRGPEFGSRLLALTEEA